MSSGRAANLDAAILSEHDNSGPSPAILADAGPAAVAGNRDRGARAPSGGLLDFVLEQEAASPENTGLLQQFLNARSVEDALRCWLGPLDRITGREALHRLCADIAALDAALSDQVNEVLHHPAFQKLEASWRGLAYLTECAAVEGIPNLQIKVLQCSWRELERDMDSAIEFDQSQVFHRVYDDHFGTPGGEPLGLLIGDYEVHPSVAPDHPHDDMSVLEKMAGVAAAAFCPFIAAASPAMFGLDDYAQLEAVRDLERTFSSPAYLRWRSLRDTEDSRFVGLTVPHVLMRAPFVDDNARVDGFRFTEDVSGPDRRKYLWANAAYAVGETVIRSFAQSGWLAGIRGVQRGIEGGGIVCRLPSLSFATDAPGIAPRGITDTIIADQAERALANVGFIPLCQCHDSEFAAFYSSPSIQKPKTYDRQAATQNSRMSSMLHYILCTSRFAHYLKVLGRDKLGSFSEPEECQDHLNNWLTRFVTPVDSASPETKAQYPLREARVEVLPDPGKPGSYRSIIYLRPHFELDDLVATVSFKTELSPLGTN